jgi:hypothetical protein
LNSTTHAEAFKRSSQTRDKKLGFLTFFCYPILAPADAS